MILFFVYCFFATILMLFSHLVSIQSNEFSLISGSPPFRHISSHLIIPYTQEVHCLRPSLYAIHIHS
jgi:hypothetical protein